jgi:DNA-binding Xre family transcriptional regulator
MSGTKVPMRYIPAALNKRDRSTQYKQLAKSRRLYKKGKFYTRKRVASFISKPSGHVQEARKIYGVDNMTPNKELSRVTGCSVSALKKIVNKGEGAYFSSGSRPNQTAQSWGLARLASSLTGGKAAAVDFDILDKGCDHKKKAFRLAKTAKRKYRNGHSGAKKIIIL